MKSQKEMSETSPTAEKVQLPISNETILTHIPLEEAPGEERGDNCWGAECCLGKRLEEGSRKGREDDRPGAQLLQGRLRGGASFWGRGQQWGFPPFGGLSPDTLPNPFHTWERDSEHKAWPCLGLCAQYPHGHLSLAHK